MLSLRLALGTFLALLIIIPAAQAQQCKQLDSGTPDDWLSYLAQTQAEQNTECVCFALRGLENMHWDPAANTLVKFLDFRCVDSREPISPLRNPYPAINGLTGLRQRALPEALAVMGSRSASELARHNAVSVWQLVFRDDEPKAVAMLAMEVDKAPTESAKQLLKEAVAYAVRYWAPENQSKCAANEPRKEAAQ